MNWALLIGATATVAAVLAVAVVRWHRRNVGQLTALERYQRDIGYLWSDREVLRAKRARRAEKRRRFWATGSAGSGGYYSDGGPYSDGGGGGGCGGGGCGGGGS